ncbi:beta-ketoacyl synthase chain length factor [uncultured Xylophilus sp.]|uniref:beta-ketoacyl synthase chain length factor n=1 Tax=uncultured Xylophilus sp. TaxID=296832 RepID=UPI0025E01224|nr:beta-ketoacyl synthase chain length factor [uncultured Xylophilus sp.]
MSAADTTSAVVAPALQVLGIGVIGPGLPDWATARATLGAPGRWADAPVVAPAPARLPPAERRRSGAIVKFSLAVAEQAVAMAGVDPRTLATVFSASSGDGANCDALCAALALPDRVVSPTRFTNSVHNAPAGYWHIGCASRAPSTSLCGYDASFGAGLLEAASQALRWRRPVLLVSADVPYPEPLHGRRPLVAPFGAALLLSPEPHPGAPVLRFDTGRFRPDACADAGLEALRTGVPAARSLPLLQALAAGGSGQVTLALAGELALRLQLEGGTP